MTAKAPKKSQADQSQRDKFIEKARELGCDENEATFKRKLKRIVPYTPKSKEKAPKK